MSSESQVQSTRLKISDARSLISECGKCCAAGEDAAKQDGRIDGGNFRIPEPLARVDIGPVIEESRDGSAAFSTGNATRSARDRESLPVRHVSALVADAQRRQPESRGGDASQIALVRMGRIAAVADDSRVRIRLFPEILVICLLRSPREELRPPDRTGCWRRRGGLRGCAAKAANAKGGGVPAQGQQRTRAKLWPNSSRREDFRPCPISSAITKV